MIIIRKIYTIIFGTVLTLCLVFLPLASIIKTDLRSPTKPEIWLKNADLYGLVINNLSSQISSEINSINFKVKPNIPEATINQILRNSISSDYFYQNLNIVLNANYQWLKGQTNQPNFLINLSTIKQSLISQIMSSQPVMIACQQLVSYKLTTLSACQNSFTESLNSDSVISSYETINQDNVETLLTNNPVSKPYYMRYSYLPSKYKEASSIPTIIMVITFLTIILSVVVLGLSFKLVRFVLKPLISSLIILFLIKLSLSTVFSRIQPN